MISFKKYILNEEKDNTSFEYIKLYNQKSNDVRLDVKFKGEIRKIIADITYCNVYKIPTWKGDVDFTKLNQIEIHDVDITNLSSVHEEVIRDSGNIYYSPFKKETTEEEAEYLKSLYLNIFVEGLKEGSIEDVPKTTIAKDAQIGLQRRRGNSIL